MASSVAVWRAIDLVLRFIYLIAAPMLLMFAVALFPIGGVVAGAGLATVVALFGSERWRETVGRIPLVGRALGGMGRLGEFYAEHPPKPLVYYIFYPVLLPVILFLRVPRREFLLYRKLNIISLLIIVIGSAIDYANNWYPDIPFNLFAGTMVGTFILQLLATFALVMPITTTIVMLHQGGHRRTLVALAGISVLTIAFGALALHKMPQTMSLGAQRRLKARTTMSRVAFDRCMKQQHNQRVCAPEHRAYVVLVQALDAAFASFRTAPEDGAAALDRAREALTAYYKPDEAAGFHLYADKGVIALYARVGKRPSFVWLARDQRQLITSDFNFDKLPPEARELLGLH